MNTIREDLSKALEDQSFFIRSRGGGSNEALQATAKVEALRKAMKDSEDCDPKDMKDNKDGKKPGKKDKKGADDKEDPDDGEDK